MKSVTADLIRRTILYLVALAGASIVVFFATYFLGRHSTLEAELERLTTPRPASTPGKAKGIPSLEPAEPPTEAPLQQAPGGEPLGEGIIVVRSPLETAGLLVVADLPALAAAAAGGEHPPAGAGLTAFLARPPAGVQLGLRALAGDRGACGATTAIKPPGLWLPGELAAALAAAAGLGTGPRDPAAAAAAAAADLKGVPGERAVVLLAGGGEECSADLCGDAPSPAGAAQRLHVILLAAAPQPGTDPGMPDAGIAGMPQPVFDPPWAAPYRCLAERSGGTIAAVTSPAELETALRRVAAELETAVVVKARHFTGQEVKGISPGGEAGWGATLRLTRQEAAGALTRESDLFPAAFSVPGGVYVVKARFSGQERTAAVAVAPGERAEVTVSFATGELFVQAHDASGGEIAGDSAGFACAWGVDVFRGAGGDARSVASSCSFPARLELAPGSYRVRARWKGLERIVADVTVEAGASSVRVVSFGEKGD